MIKKSVFVIYALIAFSWCIFCSLMDQRFGEAMIWGALWIIALFCCCIKDKPSENITTPEIVILLSPDGGDIDTNVNYARKCLSDCFNRCELPWAAYLSISHDNCSNDKEFDFKILSIQMEMEWESKAVKTVVYTDNGITPKMMDGIFLAQSKNRLIEYRELQ